MDKPVKVGMLGMGVVGTGVAKVLMDNAQSIRRKAGVPIEIKRILVRDVMKHREVSTPAIFTDKADEVLTDPEIDIVVELIGGENPAKEYILKALQAGKHVVTANKDVIAKCGKELFDAAGRQGIDLLFEASVGGGIPIIRPLKQCLAANRITEIMGIVNGTTNYMLSKMTSDGLDFATVLAEAQAQGYAEADPTADIEGWDAARKIAILASIAFGARITVDDVATEGITGITAEDIAYARELGYVVKLLAIAKNGSDGIDVRVHPAFLPLRHPLASVNGVFNAIYVRGDAVGEVMFYGRGAGQMPTASAVVADIIDVARDIRHGVSGRILCTCFEEARLCAAAKVESPYYLRLLVDDKPGVLAAIAGVFGSQEVSLNSVIQKRKVNNRAEIVLVTYRVSDANLRLAVKILEGMSVAQVASVIRVEAEEIC